MVIWFCRSAIAVVWLQTCCISRTGCECCATLLRTCCVTIDSSTFPVSVDSPRFVSKIRLMIPLSGIDTRAARGSCERHIAENQGHLQLPIKLVELGGGRCQWFNDSQRDFREASLFLLLLVSVLRFRGCRGNRVPQTNTEFLLHS